MDAAAYTAAGAMATNLRVQEISSHNLANVNTPGFKRRLAIFQPFHAHLAAAQTAVQGADAAGVVVDFGQGPINATGNPLDLALDCEGFFVVEGQQGRLYTRRGNFTLDAEGRICDTLGRPLLAEGGGKLRVQPGAGAISVAEDGRMLADGIDIGKIWVVDVPKPRTLVPAGFTAFSAPPGGPTPKAVERSVVKQGALEMSNANPIEELVAMITTLRSFEAARQTLTGMDKTSEKLAQAAQNA